MGNRQILENYVVPLKHRKQIEFSDHFVFQSLSNLELTDPNCLPALVFFSGLAFLLVKSLMKKTTPNCLVDIKSFEFKESEDLLPYFNALNTQQRDELKFTGEYYSERKKASFLLKSELLKLRSHELKDENKQIQGVPNYSILDNPEYQDRLYYFPVVKKQDTEKPDEPNERLNYDSVFMSLNYSCLPMKERE